MPYCINRYNGTQVTIVEDGTIDNTLSIKLIGKNYAGYGEVQNENFVHLLENFSNNTAPPRAISGQLWFNSETKKLQFYDGSKWRPTGSAEVSESQPSGLTIGDFWWDSANNQLWAYGGTTTGFVLVGPQAVGQTVTQMRSRSVQDNNSGTHAIIEAVIEDQTIFIISKDDDFTLNPQVNQIDGFDRIKKGITLVNTGTTGVTSSDHTLWGSASNSLKLQGYSANDFILKANPRFSEIVRFDDPGFTVGDLGDDDLKIFIDTSLGNRIPTIRNDKGESIRFQTTSTNSCVRTPMVLAGANIEPGSHNTSNIGSCINRYNTIYATTFNGTATSANYLKDFNDNSYLGSIAPSASTVAIRDTNGAICASCFCGGPSLRSDALRVSANCYVGASTSVSSCTVVSRDGAGSVNVGNAAVRSITLIDASGTRDIGTSTCSFNNVYATCFFGIADRSNLFCVGGSYVAASSAVPATTDKTSVVSRSTDGSFAGSCVTLTSVIKTPNTNGVGDIGQSNNKFNVVYANCFVGNLCGTTSGTIALSECSNLLRVDGGQYRAAAVAATANTIAARDASGNLTASVFNGIATQARYADLAEKYLADAEYETGTVVVIGGEKEVTASSWGQRAIGAVSANPAHLMNAELEGGTAIALKGRVPIKVVGAVKKGDRLIAANNGCATAAVPHANDVFAVALETNNNTDVKLVEALIL